MKRKNRKNAPIENVTNGRVKNKNDAPMYEINGSFPENGHTMYEVNDHINKNKPTMYALKTKKSAGNRWLGVACIILAAFFYSLMSLFVRLSGDIPTFQKSFFRNLVAAFVGFALLLRSGSFKMKKGSLPALLGRSIAGTVGILCNFYAIDRMNISDASILNKLAPFFSMIFSVFLLKEQSSAVDWCITALAFVGAAFVVKPTAGLASLPALIGVLGGLGAGLAYTFVRKLGKNGERTAFIVFFFSAFSCLSMLPLTIAAYRPMTWGQVGWLLLAGCAASGAQFSVTAAYKYAAAKEISVYDYSQVLFAALWGVLFLSEVPDFISVIGYVIIIGAAVLKALYGKKSGK